MPRKPTKPCTYPGFPRCPNLSETGRCPDHPKPAWYGSTRHDTLPKDWARTRQRIGKRDGWRCYLCGRPGRIIDHKVPHAQGGTDDDDNLGCICDRCSATKSATEGAHGRWGPARTT